MAKRDLAQRTAERRAKMRQYKVSAACVIVVLLLLTVMLGMRSTSLEAKNREYAEREEKLQAQVEEQQRRAEEIDELEDYVGSDEYVADVAKDKLGLVYENEIIFQPQP